MNEIGITIPVPVPVPVSVSVPRFMLEDDIDFSGMDTTAESNLELRRKRPGKVFPHLVDRAAFIDTIRLSVDTDDGPQRECLVEDEDYSTLRPGSTYAHKIEGKCGLTGNLVTVQYGKVKRFERVPSCSLKVRSESTPMTGSQINLLSRILEPTPKALFQGRPCISQRSLDCESSIRLRRNMMFICTVHGC
jgi:hypothetical protein